LVGKLFLRSFLEGSIQIIHKFWPIPEAGVHLVVRGKDQYKVDDDAVVYFCFPTLGVAVPL
jgi:hypothetical protein